MTVINEEISSRRKIAVGIPDAEVNKCLEVKVNNSQLIYHFSIKLLGTLFHKKATFFWEIFYSMFVTPKKFLDLQK